MMTKRSITISLVIIAVLLLYIIFSGKSRRSGDIPDLRQGVESIDEILITKNDKQIRLYNKEDKWFVNEDYPADKPNIDTLIKDLRELTITDFISKGQYYQKYDLDPGKAVKVTAKKSGEIKRDLYIGKVSSTYRNTYIRLEGDDRVYLASGNLADDFKKDADDLRDKQVYKVEKQDVEWIELAYSNKLTFEKKIEEAEADNKEALKDVNTENAKEDQNGKKKNTIEKWLCKEAGNIAVDKNKVDSLVESFSNVRAESYPVINKKDLAGQICIIKGKVQGKEIMLIIHKKEGENYICSSSESAYVFAIREWNAKKFFKKLSDFK